MDQQKIDEWIEKGDRLAKENNWEQAVYNYALAANCNDCCALKKLADCYAKGKGVAIDKEQAFLNYLKSAEMDPFYAAYELGKCYEEGIGTEINKKQAFEWYQKAMKGCIGDIKAKRKVCEFYNSGIGVRKDPRKARVLQMELQTHDKRMDDLDIMFRDMGI